MYKRIFDFILSLIGIIVFLPFLIIILFIIWINDFKNPFYISLRVGKKGKQFKLIKLRSMVIDADKFNINSTSSDDFRITRIGKIIRKFKIDEIVQLINVILGDMSIVGPRPNIKKETDLYSNEEKKILDLKPGITDFSSIIFSDEGEILKGSNDPDLLYNQIIRPYKSRFAIFYVENHSLKMDLYLIILTLYSMINRSKSLYLLRNLYLNNGGNDDLSNICLRKTKLIPKAPPGLNYIIR